MKTLKLLVIFSFFLIASKGISQDKIYLKGSTDALLVDVVEIGLDVIKYKPYNDSESPILNMDVNSISKLVLEDGQELTFKDPFNDPAMYADQKKNAIKLNFLALFTGSTQITFEHSVKPGQSWEATLGIVGLGYDAAGTNPWGVSTKFGYKFIKTPDFRMRGMRYAHLLKGGYVRPEVIFNVYSFDSYSYSNSYYGEPTRATSVSGAIVLNLGKQWVFGDSFMVDLFGGVGFGFSGTSGDSYNQNFNYGMVGPFDGFPLVLTGSLRVGWLLK